MILDVVRIREHEASRKLSKSVGVLRIVLIVREGSRRHAGSEDLPARARFTSA
jgi:hypothetical protein